MITINVLKRNGIALADTQKTLIDESKIVTVKAKGAGSELLYARSLDRRDRPETLVISENPTTVGVVSLGFVGLDLLNPDFTTEEVFFNPVFISKIVDTKIFWKNKLKDCVQVDFVEGAFTKETVFAEGYVDDGGEIDITTTVEVTTAEVTTEEVTTEEITTTVL